MSEGNGSGGVHTDPAALRELSELATAEPAEAGPDGAVAGYRAGRTLRLGVELKRQLRRRRTQLVLAFVAVLPFILVVAFQIGQSNPNRRSGGFVDLATASAPNFVVLAFFVSGTFLLPMIVALFFGDTIASESSWSSLKYLLAIPVPRHRLLRQKAAVSGLLSIAALVLLPVVSLLVGIIFYGAGDAISPTGDAVGFGDSLLALLMSTVYIVVQLAWVAGLALLLSVSTEAPLGAVGGTVLVAILSQILDQITALEGLRNYLPTHYSFAWIDLISTDIDWTNLASGVLSSVIYTTVFLLLAGRRFARKDVTS
ncbi:ABC transporter permease subunit [Amycolatopsis rubida]|uniref:ABC transporter permease subunit n=1 Tax=Amycolatopsis rubida TaxID=112413 RepID=A0A1I5ZJ16_9PSEU|nr:MULTISPECIES: ABC transporter permease subunit [Amycolatopsis]MYW91630.1 ABC transporter permease subunit [Amycolatopsis rubida]NEC56615.1 ABC transporter permease subunit [Amycolatopsis rubida]OAP25571.1 ABC-2 family transporter protein [Amycolatopsis sp. M39]SFQ56363.1 ABC-2 type transport system permease protein [Amycolatopsis rubida]